jgi:hypothetical protein
MLEVIAGYSGQPENMTSRAIIRETAHRLDPGGTDAAGGQAVLACWHDLLLGGQLAWGHDVANPDPPWVHLTDRGRETLKHLGRDPANPDGYLAHLDGQAAALDPVARSYVVEALKTYNANCFKATAVLVGAAAELLVLQLKGALEVQLTAAARTLPAGLSDGRVKAVRDSLTRELETHKRAMPRELADSFGAYWPALADQSRRGRNDAGHPESIDPVTPESAHAALLIFPELARLVGALEEWVKRFYA